MKRGTRRRNVRYDMPQHDRIIREKECFNLSGLSRTTRWRLERRGDFPRRRKLSENAIGWLESEILAWVQKKAAAAWFLVFFFSAVCVPFIWAAA